MRLQCDHCPWKTSTDPDADIPGGYSRDLHEGLETTIARDSNPFAGSIRIMACHESPPGAEIPCVGWMAHQLGAGNNLPLRMAVIGGRIDGKVPAGEGEYLATCPTCESLRALDRARTEERDACRVRCPATNSGSRRLPADEPDE